MKKKDYQLKIKIYGYNVVATEEAAKLVAEQLRQLKLVFNGPEPLSLPTKKRKVSLIISPHKHKDSQEQFQHTTHKRVFFIYSSISPGILKSLENLNVPNTAHFEVKPEKPQRLEQTETNQDQS
jgi:small subunit ribosomal protein S10